jgi:RNA polymerase sigma-70 factor (ECF subfamily)
VTDLGGAAAPAPVSARGASARADDLHRRYRKAVLEYCVRQLRSREEGEDAAQTVFLNAYRSLAKGTEPQSERAWLFAIAEHVVSHRRRTNSRRLRFEVPVDVDDLAYLAVAPSLEDAPDLTGLVEALSEMPALQRRAVLLREWRGLTYQEVASELGVSGTVVETLLTRGRHRLADRMQDLRRASKRRVLGLCLPLPSLQSLFGSGVAVKGLAGLASVALVTAALPLHGPATQTSARPVAASWAMAAPRAARPAHVLHPSSRGVAPTLVAFRPRHVRPAAHAAPAASPPSPMIPVETPAPAAPIASPSVPVASPSARVADIGVLHSQPAADTAASGDEVTPPALPSAGAPGKSQRGLESDPQGPPATPANANGPPPAAAPPAQSNAGDRQEAGEGTAAADEGSSTDNAAASSQKTR